MFGKGTGEQKACQKLMSSFLNLPQGGSTVLSQALQPHPVLCAEQQEEVLKCIKTAHMLYIFLILLF